MKILFIPYGTSRAPATRYRVMQYLPYLKKQKIEHSLFSAISGFSTFLMIKSPDFVPFIRFIYYAYVFIERLFRFLRIATIAKRFDIIFVQRATFPFRLEKWLKILNANIIFDIDDAIFLPDEQRNGVIMRIKKYVKEREAIGILKVSKIVIVENDYIKNFVSKYCKDVFKIPGPIDTEHFFSCYKKKSDDIVVGWIGSPATTSYLYLLDNVFKTIGEKYKSVKFKFIGIGKYKNPGIEYKRVKWNYDTEVKNLQSFDIGVMPMPNNDWTRGKLGCKMLQYMAVGIPAVVSFTPTNAEIIQEGKNGFLVRSESEWTDRLSLLINNAFFRNKIGKQGRHTIEELCSVQKNTTKLIKILESLNNE